MNDFFVRGGQCVAVLMLLLFSSGEAIAQRQVNINYPSNARVVRTRITPFGGVRYAHRRYISDRFYDSLDRNLPILLDFGGRFFTEGVDGNGSIPVQASRSTAAIDELRIEVARNDQKLRDLDNSSKALLAKFGLSDDSGSGGGQGGGIVAPPDNAGGGMGGAPPRPDGNNQPPAGGGGGHFDTPIVPDDGPMESAPAQPNPGSQPPSATEGGSGGAPSESGSGAPTNSGGGAPVSNGGGGAPTASSGGAPSRRTIQTGEVSAEATNEVTVNLTADQINTALKAVAGSTEKTIRWTVETRFPKGSSEPILVIVPKEVGK